MSEPIAWARVHEGWVQCDSSGHPLPGAAIHAELPSREAGVRERQRMQIHGIAFDLPAGAEIKVSEQARGDDALDARTREAKTALGVGEQVADKDKKWTQEEVVLAFKVAQAKQALGLAGDGPDDAARQRARDHERVLRASRQRLGGRPVDDPESVADRVAAAKAALGI